MPGYSLPPPPPGMNGMTMPYQPGFQYELQMRDQHISRLQMENVRLQVKLELAETDVKIAMQMMMAAHRFRFNDQDVISQAKTIVTPRIKTATPYVSELERSAANGHNGWVRDDGWGNNIERRSSDHGPEDLENPEGRVNEGWDCLRENPGHVEESLIDLDPGVLLGNGFARAQQTDATSLNGWGLAPVLQSPFKTPSQGQYRGPCTPTGEEESMSDGTAFKPVKPDKSRFKQLFAFAEDEDPGTVPLSKANEVLAELTKMYTDLVQPDLYSGELGDLAAGNSKAIIKISEHKIPELLSRTSNGDNKLTSSDELVEGNGDLHTRQVSESSDPAFNRVPRGPRRRQGNWNGPARFNDRRGGYSDEEEPGVLPPPRDNVIYKPSENEKNTRRSVIIYNLPPQTDVAKIVARARDSPLLWIKLLPTLGMKGKKQDGSTGVLSTITAWMTFFLESSAEQFVFELEQEPLVVRGHVAIAKLLESPTFPSRPGINTYEGALGRHTSRRIKFQQCSLVTVQEFDEVLEGQDHGYRAPGWIVDKTMKKEHGKNMITVEFASLETAHWAYHRLRTDPNFAGCWPTWVFDHGGEADGIKKQFLKAREDDEDSTDSEALGGPSTVAVPTLGTNGSGAANKIEETKACSELDMVQAVQPLRALAPGNLKCNDAGIQVEN